MNIDPSTTKYLIQARMEAEGIVEKPDVVGAVFGQTEGLLGEELDLRDLQKSGRIGRIEVDVQSKKGRSEGTILIPSSLDQVETSILAAALETIDRVGPCKASIRVDKVEDVRVTKRNKIIERARSLLSQMVEESKTSGTDLLDEVKMSVQVSEIVFRARAPALRAERRGQRCDHHRRGPSGRPEPAALGDQERDRGRRDERPEDDPGALEGTRPHGLRRRRPRRRPHPEGAAAGRGSRLHRARATRQGGRGAHAETDHEVPAE